MTEEFDDELEPDQSVTIGYTAPALPADHWSMSKEWRTFKESLPDYVPTAPAPAEAEVTAEPDSWYAHASSLAGCSDEEK
jgi:hypothetical protein